MNSPSTPRRNDPCPCGSGKRYKHCHGSLEGDRAIDRALEQRQAGDLKGAAATLQDSLAQVPNQPSAINILGIVQQELLDLDAAGRSFRRAIELQPDFADAHFNLGILLLVQGEYAEGWREYGWRTRRPGYADYAHYPFGMPRWRGEPLAGRRILVHGEQGLGDTIQCARFLEPLAREAAEVDLFCQPSLVSLMRRIRGVTRVWGTLDERPTHDFHAPILDVAAHFLPTVDAPHWDGPYISALPGKAREWASFLKDERRPLVGIAWKGNPRQVNDRLRSLSPEDALRLTRAADGVRFVNLQFGEPPPAGADWIDAAARIRDWDDTAGILESLDLVVAVDTAVAHVAGAMAKPAWTMRWFSPDWRWGATGDGTRWYPTMKLFRQETPGSWTEVIDAVAARLRDRATASRPSTARGEASRP